MEQTSFNLPIRLLPRKGSQLFGIVFSIFFTGFAIFWITMAASFTWFSDSGPAGAAPSGPARTESVVQR